MPEWEPEVWIALFGVIVAIVSAFLAARSQRQARRSADAAELANEYAARVAGAAERNNELQQQLLDLAREQARGSEAPTTGATAARQLMSSVTGPADLPVRVEPAGGSKYVLRNIGGRALSGVTIDERAVPLSRNLPRKVTLAPREGHDFLVIGSRQIPRPSTLWVTWDGAPGLMPVPMPTES